MTLTAICAAVELCLLVFVVVALSFTLDGNSFVLRPGYAVCREEVKKEQKESYLRASILKLIVVVIPLVAIATCYCRASANKQKTYVNAERWVQEERVPTSACDIADAFTLKRCLPRSVYLLCTLLVNVSCCVKPLIIAHMDDDFAIEFKRILKLLKGRKVQDLTWYFYIFFFSVRVNGIMTFNPAWNALLL